MKTKWTRTYWRNQTIQARADLICIKKRIEGMINKKFSCMYTKNSLIKYYKKNLKNISDNITPRTYVSNGAGGKIRYKE